jgi:hypothetical protein
MGKGMSNKEYEKHWAVCQYCGERYWIADGHTCDISEEEEEEEEGDD